MTRAFRADLGALIIPSAHQTTSTANPFEPPIKGKYDVSAFVGGVTLGFRLDQEGDSPVAPPL